MKKKKSIIKLKAKRPFIITLAVVSMLGFLVNALIWLLGKDFSGAYLWVSSLIMGFGFLTESQIRQYIKMRSTSKANPGQFFGHALTFLLGIIMLISGVLLAFGVDLPSGVAGWFGTAYIFAMLVVAGELFLY